MEMTPNLARYGMSPRNGEVYTSDGSVVNEADLLKPVDVIFHDAATVAADGAVFDVGNRKTLTVETYGTSSSRTIAFIGRGPSGVDRAIMGVKLSDFSTATSTTGTGELWQFDVSGLSAVFMDLQAVAGGNISVKGRAVA